MDKSVIDQLIEKLNLLKGDGGEGEGAAKTRGGTKGKPTGGGGGGSEWEIQQLKSIVILLLETVRDMTERQERAAASGGLVEGERKLREELDRQRDELDEVKQRSMKGNIIISCSSYKPNLIKSDDQLRQETLSLQSHVLDLLKEKYDVTIPRGDVQACHRLKGESSVILRIWNRAHGAAWWKLCEAMKTGMNPGINLYANFQLTERRSGLCFHLRKLKKAKKISKFYTNENGQLTFRVKEKGQKYKVTYFTDSKGGSPRTLSVQDIDKLVS